MMDSFCLGSKSRGLDSNTIVSKLSNNVKHHKELPEGGMHYHHTTINISHIQAKQNIISPTSLWESLI